MQKKRLVAWLNVAFVFLTFAVVSLATFYFFANSELVAGMEYKDQLIVSLYWFGYCPLFAYSVHLVDRRVGLKIWS